MLLAITLFKTLNASCSCNVILQHVPFFLFFPFVLGTWPHTLCSIATEVFEPVESRGMFNFLILIEYVVIIVQKPFLEKPSAYSSKL